MNEKPLVFIGSSRKGSDTRILVEHLFAPEHVKVADLLDYKVGHFDYAAKYDEGDDFLFLVHEMLKHRRIIFATPVYWYAMSGLMKVFFDRFTDIVTVQKSLGRQMKGREMYLIAVGADPVLPPGFEIPFALTAKYLDMQFCSTLYCPSDKCKVSTPEKEAFVNHILQTFEDAAPEMNA